MQFLTLPLDLFLPGGYSPCLTKEGMCGCLQQGHQAMKPKGHVWLSGSGDDTSRLSKAEDARVDVKVAARVLLFQHGCDLLAPAHDAGRQLGLHLCGGRRCHSRLRVRRAQLLIAQICCLVLQESNSSHFPGVLTAFKVKASGLTRTATQIVHWTSQFGPLKSPV